MAAASAAKRQARRTRSWCRTRARWREAEDVFGGEEDRFDALADRREVRSVPGLVGAARAVDGGVEHVEVGFELASAEVLVAYDDQRLADLALAARDQL